MDSWEQWAVDVFEDAELGDVRRSNRLVQMAAQAGRRPSGRISEVFQTDAERQGAYDFVESPHVCAEGIRRAATGATARECSCEPWVYVPLDGTSLKLWDGTGTKDFGAIGTYANGATGLKLYNAIAVSPSGVPIGVAAQVWWRRPRERTEKLRHRDSRKVSEKETAFLETGHHKPIEWLLLTNRAIETFEQVQEVVKGYTIRWRIEEFHKTWKSGMCNVESTPLHSSERAIKWATILSAVAVRVERLKYLARAHPDALASEELASHEIEALALLRGEQRKKSKALARRLSIAEAVLWLAQLGGYTGRSSGGPPGSITIARGLERLQTAAELLLRLEEKR